MSNVTSSCVVDYWNDGAVYHLTVTLWFESCANAQKCVDIITKRPEMDLDKIELDADSATWRASLRSMDTARFVQKRWHNHALQIMDEFAPQ